MSRPVLTLLMAGLVAGTGVAATGCGGGDPGTTGATTPTTAQTQPPPATTTAPAVETPDLPGLGPDAALIRGYPGWTELTNPPLQELRSLGQAHGGAKRIWASPPASEITLPYPKGAVVVKEGRTGDAITLIAIMEKVRANDDATGGWRYAEYTRPDASADFTKIGLPESGCSGCHQNANTTQKTDWVFYSRP